MTQKKKPTTSSRSRAKAKKTNSRVISGSVARSLLQRRGIRLALLVVMVGAIASVMLLRLGALTTTYSMFGGRPVVEDSGDSRPVELGVKFRASVKGEIHGIKFYKARANTGTHTGSLWTANGEKLASVTFSNESKSGWQTAKFSQPVPVEANTTYVASYYAPRGHYSQNRNAFVSAYVRGPLTALSNSESANGVYIHGARGSFPTSSHQATNYYVDVIFATAASVAPPAPAPVPPPAAVAPTWLANMETGNLAQFDLGSNIGGSNASFTVDASRSYDGTHSAKAWYGGGGQNNYARGMQSVNWREGTDVWYGAAVYLPFGFKSSMQGQVALFRWDDYPSYERGADPCGTVGGLVINSDKKARFVNNGYACTSEPGRTGGVDLVGPFDIPEGQWVHFDIHQKFAKANGSALTELYMNGSRVGASTNANIGSYVTERLRFGLVAIAAGAQMNPLTMWVDRAYIGNAMLGPVGNTIPTPTSPPAAPVAQPYVVQAESFAYANPITLYSAADAVGGSNLRFGGTATATKQVSLSGSASKITLRVRAWACSVAPQMVVKVDGVTVRTASITSEAFIDDVFSANVSAGNHQVSVGLANGTYSTSTCGNSLHFDQITFS